MTARLKAWVVTVGGSAVGAMAAHAGYAIAVGGAPLPWIGALLACSPLPLIVTWFYLFGMPRTSANLPLLLGTVVLGAGLSIVGQVLEPTASPAAAYGVAGAVFGFVYVFWYSRLGRTPSASLEVGKALPDVAFESESGEPVRVAELQSGGPLLLMFYRGNWCPLCTAQIREVAERYRALEERGVTVCFISPQSHANTASIAARFDVPARFLVDVEHRAAKALGIFHEGGLPLGLEAVGYDKDTVFPTVIITDADGVIVFCDQTDNYRVRPEPDAFLAILDAA